MARKAPAFVCAEHGRYRPPHAPLSRGCDTCWAAYGRWRCLREEQQKLRSVGHARGGGQSSKAKGRKAVQQFQQALLAVAPWLTPDDIFVKATSQTGVDLHFSPRAREWFCYATEVKCVEALNIWAALKQAEANASVGHPPLVAFKRAHTEMYVALRLPDFVRLLPWPNLNPLLPQDETKPSLS